MWWLPLAEKHKKFLAGEEVVIIMGRGHSGTRVMTRICECLGVNVGATGELKTGDTTDLKFTRTIKKVATHDIDCNFTNERKSWLQNRFDRAVSKYYQGLDSREVWGWKFPETYLIGPYVRDTFPKARYIHLLRDGRDLAFKKHLTDDPNRKLGKVLLSHLGAMDKPHHIQAALSWEYQVNAWAAFAETLPEGSVIDFRFEDILRTPRESVAQLTEFLGLEMTEACDEFLTNELDTSKARQHRENDPKQVSEVIDVIGDSLKAYGYI